jgi:CRP-like cAMP-binding protein
LARKSSRAVQSGERQVAGKPVGNKILLRMPDREYRAICPHLQFLDWPSHYTLHEAGDRLHFVCFPNTGLVSLVVAMEDGRTAEAGIVGNEGIAGPSSAVGLNRSFLREIVQIAGSGFRIRITALQGILPSAPHLQRLLNRYAVLQGLQVAQTAACNRLHNIEQRLARWLLMAQDRVDSADLPITHDFLATMLGTDRPTVSSAAAVLQRRQSIRYLRGAVRVVNRKKLESSACECYGVIQQFNGELGIR